MLNSQPLVLGIFGASLTGLLAPLVSVSKYHNTEKVSKHSDARVAGETDVSRRPGEGSYPPSIKSQSGGDRAQASLAFSSRRFSERIVGVVRQRVLPITSAPGRRSLHAASEPKLPQNIFVEEPVGSSSGHRRNLARDKRTKRIVCERDLTLLALRIPIVLS